MYPILFSLGSLHIYSYGFMVALAFGLGIFITVYFAKKEEIQPDVIFDAAIYVIISGIVGARLFYVIGQWGQYQNNLLDIFMVQKGGLVFLGGFLFCFVAVILFALLKKIPLLKLLDCIAPGAALGYAVGRLGCFLNGCCFGLPCSLPWSTKFPVGSLAYSYYPNIALHPTQLYSILAMLLAFFIILFIYRRKRYDGQVFYSWFVLYGIYRFGVEYFRFSPIHWLGLTPSQWLALIFIVAAGYGLIRYAKKV